MYEDFAKHYVIVCYKSHTGEQYIFGKFVNQDEDFVVLDNPCLIDTIIGDPKLVGLYVAERMYISFAFITRIIICSNYYTDHILSQITDEYF